MSSTSISASIDAALCDLIAELSNYSDPDFDSQWLGLQEAELEQLIVLLLYYWRSQLNGRILAGLLLELRSADGEPEILLGGGCANDRSEGWKGDSSNAVGR